MSPVIKKGTFSDNFNMKAKKSVFFPIISLFTVLCFSQNAGENSAGNANQNQNVQKNIPVNENLVVLQSDLAVEQSYDENGNKNGVNLYIRKKGSIESVMLTETTKDPSGKADNFAYRATEYNEINGNEIRYLDGKELKSEYSKYSLISSTVVNHEKLGECFHIFIPPVLQWGYPWSRSGTVKIGKGTFVNIRTFSKKYCDYTGDFQDNPFMFDFVPVKYENHGTAEKNETEEEVFDEVDFILTDNYNCEAAENFREIADCGSGLLVYSKGPETLAQDLLDCVDAINPKKEADIVFAVDTTGSMKDDMECLRNQWIPSFFNQLKQFDDVRIGLLFYRDYGDGYNYKSLPVKPFSFTRDAEKFKKYLNSAVIHGNEGGDVPEAVYEALYSCMEFYDWRKTAEKKIILIGDAQPHPKPRGIKKISKEDVILLAKDKSIIVDCIILPENKGK